MRRAVAVSAQSAKDLRVVGTGPSGGFLIAGHARHNRIGWTCMRCSGCTVVILSANLALACLCHTKVRVRVSLYRALRDVVWLCINKTSRTGFDLICLHRVPSCCWFFGFPLDVAPTSWGRLIAGEADLRAGILVCVKCFDQLQAS